MTDQERAALAQVEPAVPSDCADSHQPVPEREDAEERYCYQMLAELRRRYEETAKPYVERLVRIRSLRPAPSITLTLDQAREFIDFTMSASDGEPGCRDCADHDGTCPHDGHKCGA